VTDGPTAGFTSLDDFFFPIVPNFWIFLSTKLFPEVEGWEDMDVAQLLQSCLHVCLRASLNKLST
jgi:hypothetical protein